LPGNGEIKRGCIDLSVTFNEKLLNVPDEVNIYDLSKLDSSDSSLIAFAESIGFGGKSKKYDSDDDFNSYSDGEHIVRIYKQSGAFEYRDIEKYGIELNGSNKKWGISDDRSQEIANQFLKKLNIVNESEIVFQKVTHLKGVTASIDSDTREESIIDSGVIFSRIIDGVGVLGLGGNCIVNIDFNGDVVGFSHLMRPTKTVIDSVKIISPETVLNDIEKKFKEMNREVLVTKSSFGYFELGKNDAQTKLQPVYSFIYQIHQDDITKKFAAVIPAGTKTYEPLEFKKRFPSEQSTRAKE
jgi:hypothetical protein